MAATDDDSEPNWEAIARRRVRSEADTMANEFSGSLTSLAHKIEDSDTTHDDLTAVRNRMEELIYFIEHDLAAVVPAAERYGGDRHYYIPNSGYAADYFDITLKQATEARQGAVVELGNSAIRELVNGHTVQVQTSAGIEIELQPTTVGETESGP